MDRRRRPLPVRLIGHRIGTRRIVRVWRVRGVLWVRLYCECGDVADRIFRSVELASAPRIAGGHGEIGCRSCAAIAHYGTLTHAQASALLSTS